MRTLYAYKDYRSYLRDYYTEQKRVSRGFSYKRFSEKAEIPSPNYLKRIMDGDRNLSERYLANVCKVIGFGKREIEYFQTLVQYNQSHSITHKNELDDQLEKLRSKGYRNLIKHVQNDYLKDWVQVAIRELASTRDFQPNPKWIVKRLKFEVSIEHVQKALNFLLDAGYLKIEDTQCVVSDPMLFSSDEVSSATVRSHHRQMIELGKESVDHQSVSERELGSLTFCMSENQFPEAKAMIKQFLTAFHERFGNSTDVETGDVRQLNIQFFKLAGTTDTK